MNIDIFDRTVVVETLRANVLSANGTSGMVVGAHKVGKTHLLNHLSTADQRPADALVCRLDIDVMRASLERGQELNDDVFFDFLAGRISEGLATWIGDQREHVDEWTRDLAVYDATPAAGCSDALDTAARALRSQLKTLEVLEKVSADLGRLLEKPPLKVIALAQILDRIKQTKRRVLLIIDEFDRMVLEPKFSSRVFEFLRGVASERKIITLGSSGLHPMDGALHPENAAERRALFNHYYAQQLAPFKVDEASEFLRWLPVARPLTDEERDYMVRLGGGSPHFLKAACEQFLAAGRPPAATRAAFERGLLKVAFESGLRTLWQRCTPEARDVLRGLANGQPAAGPSLATLQSEGYLVATEMGPAPFSPLFTEFIRRQGSDVPTGDVEVTVELRYRAFPTALALAAKSEAVPIRFRIANRTSRRVTVTITWKLDRYSDERQIQLNVPQGKEVVVAEALVLVKPSIAQLTEPTETQLRYEVQLMDGGAPRRLALDTPTLVLLAGDHFAFARREAPNASVLNLTWSIAAWVTRRVPEFGAIRQEAARHALLAGYGGPATPRAQVGALYTALAASAIRYENSTMVFHQDAEDFVQRVRLPRQSLLDRAANCLDACVLMASLMSSIDLEPLILFRPGHAIVGWKERKDDLASAQFVDVTRLTTDDFATAASAGQALYTDRKAISEASVTNPPKDITDLTDFTLLIDVHREWRERKVIPLA